MTAHDPKERQPDRRSLERRQADRALQESEERYQALFDSLDCVYLHDFEGRFLDANPAALELSGYEREEILSLSLPALLDDDQLAKALGLLAELKETGSQKTPTEFRLRRKSGEYVDVETQVSVIFRDGQPYAVLGVCRGITERKQAEAALRESEQKHRRLFETMTQGVACQAANGGIVSDNPAAGAYARSLIEASLDALVTISPDGKITDVNEATVKITGQARDELIGTDFSDYFTEPESARKGYREVFAQGSVTDYPLTIRDRHGKLTDVLYNASVYRDQQGNVLGVFAAARDITEHKRTNEALRESEERVRQLFESLPQLVWTCQPEGPCDFLSSQWVRYTGVPEAPQLGYGWLEQLHPDDREPTLAAWNRGRASASDFHVEFRIRRHDGVYRWFDTHATLLRDLNGHPTKWFGSNTDISERKRTEEALRLARFSIDFASDYTFWMSSEGRFIDVSQSACARLGYSRDELLTMSVFDVTVGVPPDAWPDRWRELKEHGPLIFEKQYQTKDGEIFPVEICGTIFEYEGREYDLAIVRDISERKRVEGTLRLTQFSVDHAADCVYWSDPQGRFLYANDSACSRLGYSRDELLGLSVWDVTVGMLPEERPARWKKLKEQGSATFEGEQRTKSGETFPVEFTTNYFEHEGREYDLGIVRDSTERKRVEEALRESEENLRLAQRLSKIGSWKWTVATDTVKWSEELCQINGHDPKLPVSSFAEMSPFYTPESWERLNEAVTKAANSGEPYELDLDLVRKDGAIVKTLAQGAVDYDASGNIVGLHGTVQDITELKRAEQERVELERQLQQSQKLESLGVLAGGIAHDFNNILTSVLGNAELALCELSPSAPARENLLEITQSSRRAAALCRQMLAYSGRGQFVTELIDLRALVEDMLDLLKSTISKKILLNLNLEKGLPPLRGDASQMSQVVMNLVINASEAIGEDSGVIAISTGAMECSAEYLRITYADANLAPGLFLTLEVSDTGSGMDKETRSRLFEPFFTTKFTGRGLGLSAVLGIVRGHKGALRLYSELGKGTTFKLLFPAAEVEAGPLAKKTAANEDDWRGQGTILLVDDEETIRALGTRMLSRLGFQVHLAADGRAALEVYGEHRDEIVLVLLDLTMPRMNGEETFRELRRLNPAVRVVMSSGYTENDITSRFAGKGLAGFVHKPYTLALLRDGLRAALEITGTGSGSPQT